MLSLTIKLRWLQPLTDYNCTVTSTWVDADDPGECRTWWAWGSRIRKKQIDYTMGPRDHRSKTWYLKKDQATDLGPLPGGGENWRERVESEEGEERLGVGFQNVKMKNLSSKNWCFA